MAGEIRIVDLVAAFQVVGEAMSALVLVDPDLVEGEIVAVYLGTVQRWAPDLAEGVTAAAGTRLVGVLVDLLAADLAAAEIVAEDL